MWPKLKLLTGRMRGQAFVHFQSKISHTAILSFSHSHAADVGVATAVLEAVNGYKVEGKPLIISYGHQHNN